MTNGPLHKLHSGLDQDTFRGRLAKNLEATWVEAVILLLVVADVILVTIELCVDQHLACIGGQVVPRSGVHIPAVLLAPTAAAAAHAALVQLGVASAKTPLEKELEDYDQGFPTSSLDGTEVTFLQAPRERLITSSRRVQRLQSLLSTSATSQRQEPEEKLPHPDELVDDKEAHHAAEGEHHHAEEGGPHHAEHGAAGGHHHTEAGHAGHHGGHHVHNDEYLVCETRHGHNAHHLVHTCHQWSIIILMVMLGELLLKWYASPAHFMGNFYHKLDLFVVTISLVIDTFIMSYIEASKAEGGLKGDELRIVSGLLVLSRTWRFVRICHGLFEEYHHFDDERKEMTKENEKLKEAMRKKGMNPEEELKE